MVYSLPEARQMLQRGTDKGPILEETLFLPLWTGAASLESANGQLWRELRTSFDHLTRLLPPPTELEDIFLGLNIPALLEQWATAAPKEENGTTVHPSSSKPAVLTATSPAIARLTLCGFTQWFTGSPPSSSDLDILHAAAEALRADISFRGKGDDNAKRAANDVVVRLMQASAYPPPPGRQWAEREAFSAALQPYFISPAINFIDIYLALDSMCDLRTLGCTWAAAGFVASRDDICAHILEALRLRHPFPLLERLHGRTQFFLPLDSLFPPGTPEGEFNPDTWREGAARQTEGLARSKDKAEHVSDTEVSNRKGGGAASCPASAMAASPDGHGAHPAAFLLFGTGPRRCPGRSLAMAALPALLYNLLTSPGVVFDPMAEHHYSGRVHDDMPSPSPFKEAIVASRRIGAALFKFATTKRETRRL